MIKRVALIPARGGSKDIPKKNIKIIAGIPLILYTINALKNSKIDDVWVSTDSDDIMNIALEAGIKVIKRSDSLCTDTATSDSVLLDFANKIEVDYYYLIQCTVPLLKVFSIDKVIDLLENYSYDSVFTVTHLTKFWWNVDSEPINYDPRNRPMRQQIYRRDMFETGGMYGIRRDVLLNTGCRIGNNPAMLETSYIESIDIDSVDDVEMVEYIINGGYRW